MQTIHVAKGLELPLDVATLTSAVLGIRGSGKTNTGVVVTEGLLAAGRQVVVIDPLDVWWGLKSSRSGKSEGFAVTILGGVHGDVPLTEHDGKAVADFLVENPVPAILSLRHLAKAAQRRLVADFAERVYHRKGESGRNTPCLFCIDEASSFVPQRVDAGEARMVGAIEDWVRRGRASGIGVMLIDQRAATVNKDVLTQIELLVCHRTTSPQDRAALNAWIQAHDTGGQGKEFMDSLASLTTGEAWFWSPSWLDLFVRVKVRERDTFDSSATPKGGEAIAAPRKLAAVDLEQLQASLAKTIEDAKANDPAELKRQIAELRRQLAAQKPVPDQAAIAAAFAARDRHWEEQVSLLQAVVSERDSRLRQIVSLAQLNGAAAVTIERPPAVNQTTPPANRTPAVHQPVHNPPRPAAPGGDKIGGAERRILDAVAWWETMGVLEADRDRLALVAGYHPRSKGFLNALGALRTAGLLKGQALTEAGRAHANVPEAPTLAGVHKMLRGQLRGGTERGVFEQVLTAGGRISREQLASNMGFHPRTKGYLNALGRLRTLGIIDYQAGDVVGTELMYPRGLA